MDTQLTVPEFFEDTEIFMTGGTGVVGKALIDKLLRSCNVRRIYILLRPKKNLSIEERLQKIYNSKIFRVLRASRPEQLKKLYPIPGDVLQPNLGVTPEYLKIMENVSMVYHCAATVRFDEPLRLALKLNVGGTMEALKLAENFKNLQVFMHVSTFFSNPYLKHVEDKIYDSPIDYKVLMRIVNDETQTENLEILARKMIIGFPNTYTFTKNLAEAAVNDYRNRLPVIVFRPSIVIFTLTEPEPVFPPSLTGAIGLFALVAAGILKVVKLCPNTRLDLTPLDLCAKTMCCYALLGAEIYKRKKHERIESVPVYMSSSYKHSPHTFLQMAQVMEDHGFWNDAALEKCFLLPGCSYTKCSYYAMVLVFTKEIIPAILGDLLLRLFGKKPVLMSVVRKAFLTLKVMDPFRFNSYSSTGISSYNEINALSAGTEFDIQTDIEFAGTDEGLVKLCSQMGFTIREVLFNENPSTLPKARKILKIKIIIYNIIRVIGAYYILSWFYRFLANYVTSN